MWCCIMPWSVHWKNVASGFWRFICSKRWKLKVLCQMGSPTPLSSVHVRKVFNGKRLWVFWAWQDHFPTELMQSRSILQSVLLRSVAFGKLLWFFCKKWPYFLWQTKLVSMLPSVHVRRDKHSQWVAEKDPAKLRERYRVAHPSFLGHQSF